MWFKNLQIYRLPANWLMAADQLGSCLAQHSFVPPTSSELLGQGWVEPREGCGLVYSVNRQFLLQLHTEKKLLPASAVNAVAKARAAEMEEVQGFAPGRKAMKELKERVADELLPRAFSIPSNTAVWIDPVNGWLVVDAASPSRADDVIKMLLQAVDRMPLESLRVQRSPVAVMTAWLETDEAPVGFTVDQDAIMQASGESKAQVRYVRHSLEPDDLRRHIAAGKQCKRLAMTWNDKISFVLTETLAIKSIKPLDVIKENDASTRNDEERFDNDMMLMTGELAKMLADLVEALGGEAVDSAPAAGAVAQSTADAAPARKTGTSRAAVEMAAKMYEAHSAAKTLLGDEFSTRMIELGQVIKETAARMNVSELGAVTHMFTQTDNPYLQMETLAAAVELAEPSAGAAPVPAGSGNADDPLFDQAVTVVLAQRRASISLVQRHLRIGYNRAAGLLEAMEKQGVVSAMQSNGDRDILKPGGEVRA